jgi:hypothetical protein
MLIQTDEKSVALTPLGSLALNTTATASRSSSKSWWMELIRAAFGQACRRHSDQQPKQD